MIRPQAMPCMEGDAGSAGAEKAFGGTVSVGILRGLDVPSWESLTLYHKRIP